MTGRLAARHSPADPYVILRSPASPFGLSDPYASINLLADAIAEYTDLFSFNGILVQLSKGKLIPVTTEVLHEIIPQHIAVKQLRNSGTNIEPHWVVEFVPYTPDATTTRNLLGRDHREGSLLARATKAG